MDALYFQAYQYFSVEHMGGDWSGNVYRPERESKEAVAMDRLTSNSMPCVADAKKSPISRKTISQGPEFH